MHVAATAAPGDGRGLPVAAAAPAVGTQVRASRTAGPAAAS